jgi:hypothetical protein
MPNKPATITDIHDFLKDPDNFADHTDTEWRIVNCMTGEVVISVPKVPPVHIEGGRVLVAFSPFLIDEMCTRIVEGGSLTKICQAEGFPTYSQLAHWRRTYPWIDEALSRARRDRAEHLRDQALDEALATESGRDAPAQTLKVETLKWAAGVDHEKYNPKTKIEATVNAPTQIIVQTGIDRSPLPEPKDVTPKDGE